MAAQLGLKIREEFSLSPGSTFTNHASYGAVPTMVQEERFRLLRLMETNPDRWFRKLLRPRYNEALEELASFVGSDPENLVFVQNVTSAINSIGPEDIVLSHLQVLQVCY
jgi:isopenicillin-N epimerase